MTAARGLAWMRGDGWRTMLELAVNFLLPLLVYDLAEPRLGEVGALIASSLPPMLWSLGEFALHRRVDALSVLVLAGIALSLLAFVGGGSARWLQLRENLVSALIGLVFLGSAAIGRPLVYLLARAGIARQSQEDAEAFAAKREHAGFRRVMMTLTLVWGFGLTASAALASVLVFLMSIRAYLIVGPIVSYATMGVLALWTAWYGHRAQQRAAAAAVEPPA